MKTYLFDIATGYMTLANANKRYLKYETTGTGWDRVVTPLNEIRQSDLEFDNTQTLQIVADVVTVVPRPPSPPQAPHITRRFFLRSQDSSVFRITVTNAGALKATKIT